MHSNGPPQSLSSIEVHIYRVCSFTPGAVVPRVELIGATCDQEALLVASTIEPQAERELWERRRLVAQMPAMQH